MAPAAGSVMEREAVRLVERHGVMVTVPSDRSGFRPGWGQYATNDPDEIRRLIRGHDDPTLGIVCGPDSGVMVIDVDVGPGKVGEDSLARLERELGPLPATLTARTPSGGRHYYFKWRPGLINVANLNGDLAPDIDVKYGTADKASMTWAPPTVRAKPEHGDVPYEWEDADAAVVELPDEWTGAIRLAAAGGTGPTEGADDDPRNLIRVCEALGVRRRPGRRSYVTLCPVHEGPGSTPSLSVWLLEDRRVGVRCHGQSRCRQSDVLEAVGLTRDDLLPDDGDTSLTLEDYAELKRLPVDFLRREGLRTGKRKGRSVVEIPYHDETGAEVQVRYRDRAGVRHEEGGSAMLYGLDRLAMSDPAEPVLLVEGESDAQTAWYHGILALGLPGANSWKPAWARYLKGRHVYVWREPDEAGRQLVRTVTRDLGS